MQRIFLEKHEYYLVKTNQVSSDVKKVTKKSQNTISHEIKNEQEPNKMRQVTSSSLAHLLRVAKAGESSVTSPDSVSDTWRVSRRAVRISAARLLLRVRRSGTFDDEAVFVSTCSDMPLASV